MRPRDKYVVMAEVLDRDGVGTLSAAPTINAYITILSGKEGDFSRFTTSYYALGFENTALILALRAILFQDLKIIGRTPYPVNQKMYLMSFDSNLSEWVPQL